MDAFRLLTHTLDAMDAVFALSSKGPATPYAVCKTCDRKYYEAPQDASREGHGLYWRCDGCGEAIYKLNKEKTA
jgi:hypothetical protein